MEGIIHQEEGEEGEEEEGSGDGDAVPPNKRPVLAGNKKTPQQRRRERERREKVKWRGCRFPYCIICCHLISLFLVGIGSIT